MLTMRRASTDEDLEAYRTVFQVILPDDRCPSVADLRRTLEHRSQRVLLIVREDGELVGTGLFDQSDEVGRAATSARHVDEKNHIVKLGNDPAEPVPGSDQVRGDLLAAK